MRGDFGWDSLEIVEAKTIYLIKLINEAETLVGQDEGTGLKSPFSRDGWALNVSRKTDSRGTLASCKHCPRGNLLDVLEKLRLGRTGVSTNENVDVTANSMLLSVDT